MRELARRGATVTDYVPDSGLVVSADQATSFDGLDLAQVAFLHPGDKISPLLADSPAPPGDAAPVSAWPPAALIVEFHRDVDANDARALIRDNGLEIREHLGLLPNHLLVEGTAADAARLADWDEVAYVFPASGELLGGLPVLACGGPMTLYGPVGQAVERVGEGWDGPGQGAAQLGYFLGTLASRLPRLEAQVEILRALAEWSKAVRVTFAPVAGAAAPRTVAILFAAGSHGDPFPFDGRGRVLAHTFYPAPTNPEPIAGDMHFDDDENWGIGQDIDLFTVTLHEAGHALGLGHSDRPGTVMYPYYRRASALTADDIAAIRELYATASADPPEKTPEPPSEPADPTPPPSPPPQPKPAVPPVLTITSPAPGPAYVSPQAAIVLSGTAVHPDGIARVSWSSSRGGAGAAAGTRVWMAGPVPLQPGTNVITITALSIGGTQASRSLSVSYSPRADTVAPSLTLLSPAVTTVLTYDAAITIRGAATDNVGVVAVTWTDSLGVTGVARGTTLWIAADIPLRQGINVLTLRARDAAGNVGWRSLTVTRKRRGP